MFLCQGAVNLESVRKRMELPEDDPHHVSIEKYKRLLLTQEHPDEKNMEAAGRYVVDMLGSLADVRISG